MVEDLYCDPLEFKQINVHLDLFGLIISGLRIVEFCQKPINVENFNFYKRPRNAHEHHKCKAHSRWYTFWMDFSNDIQIAMECEREREKKTTKIPWRWLTKSSGWSFFNCSISNLFLVHTLRSSISVSSTSIRISFLLYIYFFTGSPTRLYETVRKMVKKDFFLPKCLFKWEILFCYTCYYAIIYTYIA